MLTTVLVSNFFKISAGEVSFSCPTIFSKADKPNIVNNAPGTPCPVQSATAKGIELVKKAGADEAVLRLEAYKAMVEVANGQATKLIIPSDMQGIVGLAASVFESERTRRSSWNLQCQNESHCHI